MGRILKHNTIVRRVPYFGEIVRLRAGEEAPDWALDQLGEHLFEEPTANKPVAVDKRDRSLPKSEPKPEPVPERIEVPNRGAHVSQWRKFLEAHNFDVPKGTSRDEMIEMAEEKIEGIEIPEDEE